MVEFLSKKVSMIKLLQETILRRRGVHKKIVRICLKTIAF